MCVTKGQRCFRINLVIVLNHVHSLVIVISTFHYSKNVSAIDNCSGKCVSISVFDTSQLVRLNSKGDNSFFLFQYLSF